MVKNTLTRYLDYLEAAFLIQRMTAFKVYLTNPIMRAALFGPVDEGHEAMGPLVETALFSQWLHNRAYIDSL